MAELVTLPSARNERDGSQNRNNEAPQEQGGTLDVRLFLNILKRRRAVIFGTGALLTLLSMIVIFQLTPLYTAESVVMLDTRKTQIVDIQAVMAGLQSDVAAVRTEVELLKSPDLTEKVVKKLNLMTNPLINRSLARPSFWAKYDLIGYIKGMLSHELSRSADKVEPLTPEDADQRQLTATVRGMLGRLAIINDGRSYIIKIQFQSEDPALAAQIANAYADLYLLSQLEAKYAATKRASDWLSDQLGELRDKLRASDDAVQQYKDKNGLNDSGKGVTVTDQQLSEVNTQLVAAAADRGLKEANLRQVQDTLNGPGGAEATAPVLASSLISSLRLQETELLRNEAQMATRYRPEHPAMINIHAQIKDLQDKIKIEVGKIIRGLTNDVNAARAREAALRTSLQQVQVSAQNQNKEGVGLRELEREAQANRMLYENFLNRFKQTSSQEDIQQADARLVAVAQAPTTPTFPRRDLFTEFALVFSMIFGVVVALFLERLDNGFRNAEQIERLAGLPYLGLVPGLGLGKRPQDVVVQQPISSYGEAIRSVRTALRFTNIDQPPRIVVVTSSIPGEGKTVFAASLARSVARSGGRALLIDCDLRRPSVHRVLKTPEGPGLVSMFSDGTKSSEIIRVDAESTLNYITAGEGTANPQDLLGSQQMRNFLDGVRDQYDLIVLDTPPVLAVSDALVLSHIADATLFLIRWETTPRPIVLGALKVLRAQGGRIAGAALTRVNIRKHSKYGYGDSAYYYGRYGYYYRARKKAS